MTAAKVLRRIMMTLGNPFESAHDMPTEKRLKEIASLNRRKHRDALGECVIEGTRSLESALDGSADILEVFTERDVVLDTALARRLTAPVHVVDRRTMSRLSDTQTPPGVLAVVKTRYADESTVTGAGRVLVLDGIQDPGNVGTLVRSAAWFGIDAVVAGPGSADFFHPKTLRATMGSIWDVHVHATESSEDFLVRMKASGRAIWVADMDGLAPDAWAPAALDVLVLGSEAHGVGPWIRPLATGAVSIPRATAAARAVESLNVAAAGAVLMARWAAR